MDHIPIADSEAQTTAPRRCDGLVAAVITPCRVAGQPDPDAMTALCRRLVAAGCDGLFVVGSTGEMPLLDDADRTALIAAARRGAGGAMLYAGVSGTGLAQTLRHARAAAEAGADVAIVMAPFFLKLGPDELAAYFTAIADACPLPVGLYHHLRMPSEIGVDTVRRLADHPNIVVMKDTSTEGARLREMASAVNPASISLMQGREPLVLESLGDGAAGCVTALAGVVPEWHRELLDAHALGDEAVAAEAQNRIDRLAELFTLPELRPSFARFGYAIRRALHRRGWLAHTAGMIPGFEPSPALNAAIDRVLDEAEIPDAAPPVLNQR